jgi:3',5'-cyclic AMP phosphodiesterase CpdA
MDSGPAPQEAHPGMTKVRELSMPEFRLTQISDCHLARNRPTLTENFHRVSEYIDTTRPDVVVNSGDVSFDGPDRRADLEFAKALHDALPIACHYLPDNRSRRRPRLCRREKRRFEDAQERLRITVGGYAEEITGDRTALHAKPASIGR